MRDREAVRITTADLTHTHAGRMENLKEVEDASTDHVETNVELSFFFNLKV